MSSSVSGRLNHKRAFINGIQNRWSRDTFETRPQHTTCSARPQLKTDLAGETVTKKTAAGKRENHRETSYESHTRVFLPGSWHWSSKWRRCLPEPITVCTNENIANYRFTRQLNTWTPLENRTRLSFVSFSNKTTRWRDKTCGNRAREFRYWLTALIPFTSHPS